MLQSKQKLEKYLTERFHRIITDTEMCANIYSYANKTYNIPKDMVSDLVSMRIDISEASEFVLFIILDSVNVMARQVYHPVEEFYTEQEIKTYRNSQYKVDEIEFPIVFNMIQVAHDQWIGNITSKELMKLRKAQLINYNENAQRMLQRIIKGEKEFFKIAVNKSAVNAIQESYINGRYIPNTLTLNIPLETEYDFKYDNEKKCLIIKNLEHFDITDGYHRYLALSQASYFDADFDYPMELRVVNFSEEKARQFIFQEDQKTKMRKIDSDAMDTYKAANIVAARMNESMRCNLHGMIGMNNTNQNSTIPLGDFTSIINYFYFRDKVGKETEKTKIMNVTKKLIDDFNTLTELEPEYLTKIYTFKLLIVIFTVFENINDNNRDKMPEIISYVHERLDRIDPLKFNASSIRKTLITDLVKLIKEAEEYV